MLAGWLQLALDNPYVNGRGGPLPAKLNLKMSLLWEHLLNGVLPCSRAAAAQSSSFERGWGRVATYGTPSTAPLTGQIRYLVLDQGQHGAQPLVGHDLSLVNLDELVELNGI